MKRLWEVVVVSLCIGMLLANGTAEAQDGGEVVRAVLFYSPTCPHCHTVMEKELPPIQEKYGDQFRVVQFSTATPEGSALYRQAAEILGFDQYVPAFIVGDQAFIGSGQLPQALPLIIEEGLASGGIDWPDVPGLAEAAKNALQETPSDSASGAGTEAAQAIQPELPPLDMAITLLTLGALTLTFVTVSVRWAVKRRLIWEIPAAGWQASALIPLTVLGVIVAGYLSYVEVTASEAVCGPVGDCNAVQQSDYAKLLGILPVGVMGLGGYAMIFIVWASARWDGRFRLPERYRRYAPALLLALALFGTGFSTYLTFLEAFVIRAMCLWCITSAWLMILITWWASLPLWGSTMTSKAKTKDKAEAKRSK
jgi:uncharacterized membrane protein